MKTKTYYFKKVKGVNGLNWYYVESKKDIPYLGSLNSKFTLDITKFKKFMKEYYHIKAKIIKL